MTTHRTIPIVPEPSAVTSRVTTGQSGLVAMPPLTLYIHVPWCIRKCPYCDFNSHQVPRVDSASPSSELVPEDRYLEALAADLEQALPLIWGRQIHAVFIGGGTPSLLSAQAVDRLMAMIRAYLSIWPDAEITLEANPGAAEAQRFKAYAQSGVNRLSLGIQSFNDSHLTALGRVHSSDQAHAAVEMAQNAFKRVNLDLMYGLPNQSLQACEQDIESAIAKGTEHLSLYQLTLEPNTVFAKYPPTLPDDEVMSQMEEMIQARTQEAGFDRYEVSAYAKMLKGNPSNLSTCTPSQSTRSQHNLNYWTFGDYVGIGPGAHSKISNPFTIERLACVKNPEQWMQAALKRDGSHWAVKDPIEPDQLPFEFMLNALRLQEGVPTRLYRERTGQSIDSIAPILKKAQSQQLLIPSTERIGATPLGWRHLNTVLSLFMAPH